MKIMAGIFLAGLLLAGYGVLIEPYQVAVRHLWLGGKGKTAGLAGKTGVHISDLHMGRLGTREKKVLRIVGEIDPDFIFLTGDYVKWRGDYGPALDFLGKLRARSGIWAVMGDYDRSDSRKSCLFCHKGGSSDRTRRHGVRFLQNAVEKMPVSGENVMIGGVDPDAGSGLKRSLETVMSPGAGAPAILLSHSPLAFDLLSPDTDVLVLAGDTHGGQLPLPAWLWRLAGYEKNARYNRGLFRQGRKKMFVSRGIGTSHLPIRLFRKPEIMVLHF